MYPFMGNDDEDLEELDEMIKEEEKKSPSKKILVCPVCNSTDVMYDIGGALGYQYRCKNCGYVGAFILEK